MTRKFYTLLLTALLVAGLHNIKAQSIYTNVLIDRQDLFSFYPPCEPSIAISPLNPALVVAGSILDKVYTSADTGRTWTKSRLRSRYGVYGDPCVVAGNRGDFYYLHLSNPAQGAGWSDESFLDRIVCHRSRDGGRTWSDGSSIGRNGTKDQDKEWAVCSPDGRRIYATWTQFDKYESTEPGDSTNIMFSYSSRKARKWKNAVRINQYAGDCSDDDPTTEGAVPACGPGGEVYVAWALNDRIYFDRSFDGGKTWLDKDLIPAEIVGGWNHQVPGIMRCNGMPVTVCDLSAGPYHGHIYICWADQRNGTGDTDVFLTRSADRGNTWSNPVRVNDDAPGRHQFFPWLAVDQATGALHVVFYDRRNYDDWRTDVFVATSVDGGETWLNERISESPFIPDPKVFFGDYTNISAERGVVRPIWTRCDQSKLSVWTALVNLKP